jgi:hypothetical protein
VLSLATVLYCSVTTTTTTTGIAGMWVQEALTGQGVFEQIATGHLSPVADGQVRAQNNSHKQNRKKNSYCYWLILLSAL